MKLTVEDIYDLAEGIAELSQKELPTKTAFRISRNHRKLIEEVKTADELRQKIVDKYKEKDTEEGAKIKKGQRKAFKEEFDELMEQEVDIKLSAIKLFEIGDTVKPRTLSMLDKIIKEDEENEDTD